MCSVHYGVHGYSYSNCSYTYVTWNVCPCVYAVVCAVSMRHARLATGHVQGLPRAFESDVPLNVKSNARVDNSFGQSGLWVHATVHATRIIFMAHAGPCNRLGTNEACSTTCSKHVIIRLSYSVWLDIVVCV